MEAHVHALAQLRRKGSERKYCVCCIGEGINSNKFFLPAHLGSCESWFEPEVAHVEQDEVVGDTEEAKVLVEESEEEVEFVAILKAIDVD